MLYSTGRRLTNVRDAEEDVSLASVVADGGVGAPGLDCQHTTWGYTRKAMEVEDEPVLQTKENRRGRGSVRRVHCTVPYYERHVHLTILCA